MPSLTTPAMVKKYLEIPHTDISQDEELGFLITGVEEAILKQTGYDLIPPNNRTQYFHGLAQGRKFHLEKRPVSSITTAEGRSFGSTTWTSLTADLLVPEEGLAVIMGEYGAWSWPPIETPSRWFRWRHTTWDLVKIVYVTTAWDIGDDFREAFVGLCAYLHRRIRAGASKESTLAGIHDSFLEDDVPPWIRSRFAPHIREEIEKGVSI